MSSSDFLLALAQQSIAGGVVILLVLALQRIFRRQLTPQWHCALWLLVLVRLLPLSLSSDVSIFNLLPRWPTSSVQASTVPTFPLAPAAPLVIAPATSASSAASASLEATSTPMVKTAAEGSGYFASWTWTTVLFAGWLGGVIALSTYVIIVSLALRRSLARLKPLRAPAVLDILRHCCTRMGVSRAPEIVASETVRTPALHGLLRPRLLLPIAFATSYSSEEQRFVFLHELAHLRRRDLLLNWLVTGLQIVHWFNPLVWYGFARWRVDREIACDAAALEASGAEHSRAYGQTMLRLLEHVSIVRRHPGLVGILEDKRQLRRRMRMIAGFTPARRSLVAAGVFVILALIGLTDARVGTALTAAEAGGMVAPAPAHAVRSIPAPLTPYVLFLVNGSETMLSGLETPSADGRNFTERGRAITLDPQNSTDDQKRAAPKWVRARETLEQMLNALPAQTDFQVAIFSDDRVEVVGGRIEAGDAQAVRDTLARVGAKVPGGLANLESAFAFVAGAPDIPKPERVVLITDGLPTASQGSPATTEVSEGDRIRAFTQATKRLPPRVPVQTILIPSQAGDPGAAGLFWQLANATRGQLTTAANSGVAPRTHLAFVIDTSGSMRDPNNGGVWPGVITALEASLDLHPDLVGLQLIDGDGRFMLPRKGTGAAGWLPNTPETRETMKSVLRRYNQDTVSNPTPGINNALRFLSDKHAPAMRMGICVFGDEFNSSDPASRVLDRIDTLNPRDASGRRPVTISAIGFPTTIRYQFSMGNTGLRFANLMRQLTYEHDGSFVALPEL